MNASQFFNFLLFISKSARFNCAFFHISLLMLIHALFDISENFPFFPVSCAVLVIFLSFCFVLFWRSRELERKLLLCQLQLTCKKNIEKALKTVHSWIENFNVAQRFLWNVRYLSNVRGKGSVKNLQSRHWTIDISIKHDQICLYIIKSVTDYRTQIVFVNITSRPWPLFLTGRKMCEISKVHGDTSNQLLWDCLIYSKLATQYWAGTACKDLRIVCIFNKNIAIASFGNRKWTYY